MNYEVMWVSEGFGIELKINPTKRSINALKKFIEVLEVDLVSPETSEEEV